MLNLQLMPAISGIEPPGVFVLPFEENYYPRLLHATMRQLPAHRSARRIEHAHDVYHIVLVTNGRGTFLFEGAKIPTQRGDLHLVGPGELHSFEPGLRETTEYCEVTLQFVTLKGRVLTMPFHKLVERWAGLPCLASDTRQASPELYALIVREGGRIVQSCLRAERDTPLRVNQSLNGLFHGLLTHWFRLHAAEMTVAPLELAFQHIQAHFNEPISLTDLAVLSHLSANYLSRAFKSRYGVTPIYHQHQLRVQAAKTLLQTTHYPLKRIAELTGFCDEHYLSRIFRKYESMPPNQYRRRLNRAVVPKKTGRRGA